MKKLLLPLLIAFLLTGCGDYERQQQTIFFMEHISVGQEWVAPPRAIIIYEDAERTEYRVWDPRQDRPNWMYITVRDHKVTAYKEQ